MAILQPRNIGRGKQYSPYGVEVRGVRPDMTTCRNTIHYLNDGNCTFRFNLFKREYLVPVIILLKAFIPTTDREIYEKLTQGDERNTFLTDRVELFLREAKQYSASTTTQALSFLGSRFRTTIRAPSRTSDKAVGEEIIRRYVLVHLNSNQAKFNYMMYVLPFSLLSLYSLSPSLPFPFLLSLFSIPSPFPRFLLPISLFHSSLVSFCFKNIPFPSGMILSSSQSLVVPFYSYCRIPFSLFHTSPLSLSLSDG